MWKDDLKVGTTYWAVNDEGEVVWNTDQEWIQQEFPTQLHVRVTRQFDSVTLSTDTGRQQYIEKDFDKVDDLVISFSNMVNALIGEYAEA